MSHPDGAKREGIFVNNLLQGPGILILRKGAKLEGKFVDNDLQGPGTITN